MKYIILLFTLFFLNLNIFCEQVAETIQDSDSTIVKNSKNLPLTGFIRRGQNIEFYKNGVPHGKWLQFYPNGSLKCIENWNEGKLSGKYILYKNDETKILENNYFNGKDHGKYFMFHENGGKYITAEFEHGKPIGIWYYYSDHGKLVGTNDFTSNSSTSNKKLKKSK